MNVVLYTRDFEPITVLDLPMWLLEQMEKQGQVKVAVQEPVSWMVNSPEQPVTAEPNLRTVTLECLRIRWLDSTNKTIIVTQDDELALALKPDWLPGQRAQVNNYKETITNLVNMLKKAMRPNE